MANRREAQQSDNTVDSWTSSLVCDIKRNFQLEEKLSKEAETQTPQQLLHRLLSTKSAISSHRLHHHLLKADKQLLEIAPF